MNWIFFSSLSSFICFDPCFDRILHYYFSLSQNNLMLLGHSSDYSCAMLYEVVSFKTTCSDYIHLYKFLFRNIFHSTYICFIRHILYVHYTHIWLIHINVTLWWNSSTIRNCVLYGSFGEWHIEWSKTSADDLTKQHRTYVSSINLAESFS